MAGRRETTLKVTVLQDSKGSFDNVNKSLDELNRAAVGVSTALVAGVGAGAVAAVKAASDLQESANAVSVVFGDASGTIEAFGATSAQSVGLSQSAFNQLATSTGSLLQNFGYDSNAAADATVELATRAADMASVFNTDVDTALSAINAGLRGETEPLRAFGVSIDDASLKGKALELGLYDGVGALDANAKAAATHALVLEQTEKVAGDFANTSDSAANRQRILAASVTDLAAQLGEALLPIVETIIEKLQAVVEWVSNNEEAVTTFIGVITAFAAVILTANAAIKAIRVTMIAWNAILTIIRIAQTVYLAIGIAVTAVNWAMLGPILLIVLGIAALIAIIILAVKNWDKILDVMKKVINWIKDTAVAVWDKLTSAIDKVIDALKKVWDWVKKLLDSGLSKIGDFLPFVGGSVAATVAATVATSRGAARTSGPIAINFYGTVTDSEGTAREIRRVLSRSDMRNARTVGDRAW